MAPPTPHVEQGTLALRDADGEQHIEVGAPAWFRWVETATSFTFASPSGGFTARRERAGSGRGGWYWRAYQHRDGVRQRAYLGVAAELSLERLEAVAAQLATVATAKTVGRSAPGSNAPLPPASPRVESVVSAPHLLTTKLHLPRARPDLVVRSQLFARLDAGLHGVLTLVCAPAGFGKTTLLAEWLRGTGRPTAWLGLDAGDGDPTTFMRYLVAALQQLAPAVGTPLPALLQSPTPPPLEVLLTILLNDLARLPAGSILVLDDYHVIAAPAIHQALAFFVEHLPPSLHLVIATREDPPLPLARLRARRQVAELRVEQLRFTAEETASFLTEMMALQLSANDVATLEARTEGWIAGLQLAALAMQEHHDRSGFIAAFAGSNRFVMDYLADEVLGRQPPHLQAFLLNTSILGRMCGPLCDAVMGVTSDELLVAGAQDASPYASSPAANAYSQSLLEQLERANLFVIPLDGERRWYRYHHLFAEVLRQRLAGGAHRDTVAALHQRASAWFEHVGLAEEAVHHALVAQDWPRAARLIERYGLPIAARGQAQTVLGWLAALPEAFVRRQAPLCVIAAATLIIDNQPGASEPLLQAAEAGAQALSPEQARLTQGQVAALRAASVRISGDLERALTLAQQSLELLPESEPFWRTAVASNLSRAYLVSGDVTSAIERAITTMVEPARASGNPFAYLAAIVSLARLQVLQGRLRVAAATYREALQVVPEPAALQHSAANLIYHFGLGDLLREWNDLDAAAGHLEQGMALLSTTRSQEAETVLVGHLALARLKQAYGDIDGATQTVAAFLELASQRGFAQVLVTRAVAFQARLALAQGGLAAAAAWAEANEQGLGANLGHSRELEHLTLARVRIAQGRADPASPYLHDTFGLLEHLLGAAEASERFSSVIEIRILQALAFQAQGATGEALSALEGALQRAAPEGYVRLFVDEGAPMAVLLREVHRRGVTPDYTAKLLAAFPTAEDGAQRVGSVQSLHPALRPPLSALVEPLTARELEVLQLVAAGASNGEIARRLIVSIGTVKKHTANIFGKLQVQSRTQAVARARELALL